MTTAWDVACKAWTIAEYTAEGASYLYTAFEAYRLGEISVDTYRKWNVLTDAEKNDRIKLLFVGVFDVASVCVGASAILKLGNVQRLSRIKIFLDVCSCSVEINRRINVKIQNKKDLDYQDYLDILGQVALPRLAGFSESIRSAKIPYVEKLGFAVAGAGVVGEFYGLYKVWKSDPKAAADRELDERFTQMAQQMEAFNRNIEQARDQSVEELGADDSEESSKIKKLINNPKELKKYLEETASELENYRSYLHCANENTFFNELMAIPDALQNDKNLLKNKCACCNKLVRFPLVKHDSKNAPIIGTLYDGLCLRNWDKKHPGEAPPNWNANIGGTYNEKNMRSDPGIKYDILKNLKLAYKKKTELLKKKLIILIGLLKIENIRRITVSERDKVRVLSERVDKLLHPNSSSSSSSSSSRAVLSSSSSPSSSSSSSKAVLSSSSSPSASSSSTSTKPFSAIIKELSESACKIEAQVAILSSTASTSNSFSIETTNAVTLACEELKRRKAEVSILSNEFTENSEEYHSLELIFQEFSRIELELSVLFFSQKIKYAVSAVPYLANNGSFDRFASHENSTYESILRTLRKVEVQITTMSSTKNSSPSPSSTNAAVANISEELRRIVSQISSYLSTFSMGNSYSSSDSEETRERIVENISKGLGQIEKNISNISSAPSSSSSSFSSSTSSSSSSSFSSSRS